MYKKIVPFILLFIFFASLTKAQNIPPRPNPPRLVNDFAGILSDNEEQALELKLRYFNDTTSNQIAIVTVKSLDGYDKASYAYEIGETWKVGQSDFDNGVVILVKPKYQNEKGQTYIAVGYGLEPAIPDAISKRIVENEMLPAFRNNDYYRGLNDATTVLMQLAAGEISAEGYNEQTSDSPLVAFLPIIIILIIFFLMRSTRNRSHGVGSKSNLPFWSALWLGSSMNQSHSGSWNNFSGGGSGFGGGGGSFGGFGGGSFGGGGAGGSW